MRSAILPAASILFCVCGCSHYEEGLSPKSVASFERSMAADSVGVSLEPPVRRAPPQFEDTDTQAVKLFFDVLEPFGSWLDDTRLGLVWIPSAEVGPAFVPYGTHGHWTYRKVQSGEDARATNEYVWVSDLPWGWVTFHYGRWAYTGERGWAWVAGRRYAGAWVDWRAPRNEPRNERADEKEVIGWGPTPPAHIWRVSPGEMIAHDARLVPVPYAAFATPYVYARPGDLFAKNLGAKLLQAASAYAVANGTDPGEAPAPEALGLHSVPAPPAMDRGLQQAWMLATPAVASAVGAGPELASPPHLRTWVAGGPRYTSFASVR